MLLPNIPRKEQDIITFCTSILEFVSKHPHLGTKQIEQEIELLKKEYTRRRKDADEALKNYQNKSYLKDQVLKELISNLRALRKRVLQSPNVDRESLQNSIKLIDRKKMIPSCPRDLVAERMGAGVITLTWKRPKRGTGGRVLFFEIHCKEKSQSNWAILDTTDGIRETATVRGLAVGVELEFKIISKNQVGRSPESSNIVKLIL